MFSIVTLKCTAYEPEVWDRQTDERTEFSPPRNVPVPVWAGRDNVTKLCNVYESMAAYRRVYDSRHLQADCQEPGSAPEPYAQ